MTVLIVERAPTALRGELTRWLLEPGTGVFVGRLSALVREKLWAEVCRRIEAVGGAVLIYPAANEQGFSLSLAGDRTRIPVDYDGLTLIRRLPS